MENTHIAIALDKIGVLELLEKIGKKVQVRANMPQILSKFVEKLPASHIPHSVVYLSLINGESRVKHISDVFLRHNNFDLLGPNDIQTINLIT